jgi:multidrug resistance protein EbrB
VKGYVPLGAAILSEIFGSSMLKLSEGFTHVLPSLGVAVGFGLAFYLMSVSLRTIPLSTAYAIWSGVGTVLTALIGVLIWKDPLSLMSVLGIVMIVGGVVLLHSAKGPAQQAGGRNEAIHAPNNRP